MSKKQERETKEKKFLKLQRQKKPILQIKKTSKKTSREAVESPVAEEAAESPVARRSS